MKPVFECPQRTRASRNVLLIALVWAACARIPAQAALPMVAIHDSELTRALEKIPASGATPTGPGTTGFQWWTTNWHYFVMADAMKEALRSDGTAFTTVGDSNIMSGVLLDAGGNPNYPIVISLASEAIDNSEVASLTNYVAAGGVLFVGSSSFTRNTNGTTRGDFALASQMGMHMVNAALTNWNINATFTVVNNDFLVSHIPQGTLTWQMPSSSEETSWPEAFHPPNPPNNLLHLIWQVNPATATVIAQGDANPYILIQPYGKGWFIYEAAMEPLLGHGGWAPGMYAYGIIRNAIQWAFQNSATPLPKLSPWPYQYNAAVMFRHDMEGISNLIVSITPSAQWESTNGARGDYFFCTGELREDMGNPSNTVAALQQDVKLYGATISSHNGGLANINPYSPPLTPSSYDYWHWGPDEMLDDHPAGYASGQAFARASISNSFNDLAGWFGTNNGSGGVKMWVTPYFNGTREGSMQIDSQLGIQVLGDDKLSPFPHWTYSTQTPDLRYPMLTLPVSDWFVGSVIAQAMEHYTSASQMQAMVDYYYNLGTLINLYSHSSSDGSGAAGALASQYVTYSLAKPLIWSANSASIYNWWVKRSTAQMTPAFATNGNQVVTMFLISAASDTNTAVELLMPGASFSGLQVFTNGIAATGGSYRINGQLVKVRVGTSITNVQVRYTRLPMAANYVYQVAQGGALTVPPPGVLTNDTPSVPGRSLSAALATGPADGTLNLNANGGFTYAPATNFAGVDRFVYLANDGITNSLPATATLEVIPPGDLFYDNFTRPANADPLAPWVQELGAWTITNGELVGTGSPNSYGYAFYSNTNWTDYSVQARVQLSSANGWAGGIGGHLNPVTGAHYGAWIYPDGSPGGSNVLKLIKFEGWTTWSSTPMAQASLPSVGTGFHTLLLAFQGTNITVSYDGAPKISVADNNFDGVPPLNTGGITADMYTDLAAYQIGMDDVVVTTSSSAPLITVQPASQTVNAGTTVNFIVVASGPSLNYQWMFGSSPLSGAALATLTLPAVSNANAGAYSVIVSNAFGHVTSAPATLTVNTVTNASGPLFSDDFTRPADPGPLTPWTAQSGTWTVTGGRLLGGTNAASSYASVYFGTNWANYAVQARFQFLTGGYGGGLAGRLNAASGARYAAWIYPDGSPGGPDMLRLVKFQSWTAWGYNGVSFAPMQQVSLPAVGTNWHTVKLAFNANRIVVYYDANQVISMTDTEATPYLSGGIGMDMWTGSPGYAMSVDDVIANPLVVGDSYTVNQGAALTVAAPGVLGNDTEVYGTTLSASLLTGPTNGTLDLSTNGGFTYTPAPSFAGTDSFVYQANDGQTNLGSAQVVISVNAVSSAPAITSEPASRTNIAGTTATLTVVAGGTAPLGYHWFKNGTVGLSDGGNVSGSAGATLTLSNVLGGDGAGYTVVVSNSFGSVTSAPPAVLTVIDPVITSQPASRTNIAGTTATLTVVAGGTASGYQWLMNNVAISGATGASLTLAGVSDANAGSYTVVVSNAFGAVTSSAATLTVVDPPVITGQPASRTNTAGTAATFTVTASGSPGYQWLKNVTNALANGGNVSGANTPTLTLASVSASDAAAYSVIVSNAAGSVTSLPATLTVTASTNPPTLLFSDNFSRSTDPGPLAPWVAQSGTWTVTGGVLKGGTNTLDSYGDVYITNSWSNYTAQAQIQFPVGAYGGGLGGFVNPKTGAHYAAWIYPEGSPGGSSILKLVKFQTWTTWGYLGASFTPMQQASLPGVGTNWHTLTLAFVSGQISVSFDSNQVISATDAEATPYTSGAISLDMWTDSKGYIMTVDNVAVNANTTGNAILLALPLVDTTSGASPARPVIQSVVLRGGIVTLAWSSVPGQTYQVQYNDALSSTGWLNLAPAAPAGAATATATDAVGVSPQRFYRVLVVP